MERVQHRQEEDARAGHRGGDVAEHVDLGPARALRPVAQAQRHAAGLERSPHRAAHVHDLAAPPPARLVAPGREPALQLGDDAVDLREVLERAAGQGAVVAPRAACAGGRLSVRWISARSSSRRRWPRSGAGSRGRAPGSPVARSEGCWRRSSVRRMRCTSTPITPELSPWPPNAATASRARSRHVAVAARRGSRPGSAAAGRRGRCGRRPRSAAP